MDFENINSLWNLHDTLTVEQAAALIAGIDPNYLRTNSIGVVWLENECGVNSSDGIYWYRAAFSALANAINARKIKARRHYDAEPRYTATGIDNLKERGHFGGEDVIEYEDWATDTIYVIDSVPNWKETTVDRDDLIAWLAGRGHKTGFFFPDSTDSPDYLDPKNARYAPKLAAAVMAWQSVTDPNGAHPKQALKKWLNEHAAEYGLTGSDGLPAELSVEDCAKVANWKPGGGAPTTPGE